MRDLINGTFMSIKYKNDRDRQIFSETKETQKQREKIFFHSLCFSR